MLKGVVMQGLVQQLYETILQPSGEERERIGNPETLQLS